MQQVKGAARGVLSCHKLMQKAHIDKSPILCIFRVNTSSCQSKKEKESRSNINELSKYIYIYNKKKKKKMIIIWNLNIKEILEIGS